MHPSAWMTRIGPRLLVSAVGLIASLGALAAPATARERHDPAREKVESAQEALQRYRNNVRPEVEIVRAKQINVYGDRNPFEKPKAAKRWDRVTIIVNDNTTAALEQTTELDKETAVDFNLTKWFTIRVDEAGNLVAVPRINTEGGNVERTAPFNQPDIAWESERSHEADSSTDATNTISTTLSGWVLDVLPNGYLKVEATNTVVVGGERRVMTVTGVVSPDDLNEESEINASRIMDLKFAMVGKGPLTDTNKRGWLARIIDKISPY